MNITIELPDPEPVEVSDRGLRYLGNVPDGVMVFERSHAEHPHVEVEVPDAAYTVEEAERIALALLWLVRNHYHGQGLASELEITPIESTYKLELPRDQVDTLLEVLWHHVTPAMGLDQSLHDEIQHQVFAQGGKSHA